MRQVSFVVSTVAALVISGGAARAVDVYNGGDITHELTVEHGTEMSFVEVPPGNSIQNICAACTVSLEDAGSLDVAGKQRVLIQDGHLRLEKTGGQAPADRHGVKSK